MGKLRGPSLTGPKPGWAQVSRTTPAELSQNQSSPRTNCPRQNSPRALRELSHDSRSTLAERPQKSATCNRTTRLGVANRTTRLGYFMPRNARDDISGPRNHSPCFGRIEMARLPLLAIRYAGAGRRRWTPTAERQTRNANIWTARDIPCIPN